MDRSTFWKNFKLGEELHISGAFIYNALRSFHEIESYVNDDEVFEALYQLAVGLERIMKVAVVLIEHSPTLDQEEFEESLRNHNHSVLAHRIKNLRSFTLSPPQNDLLHLLTKFYKTHRYERFSLSSENVEGAEVEALHKYLQKYLKISIVSSGFYIAGPHHKQIRRFIGKTVGKLTRQLFALIRDEARQRNIYTYELRTDSKAYQVFLREAFDFLSEDVLLKEILIYLFKKDERCGPLQLLDELDPLEWDEGLIPEYLQCFTSYGRRLECMDQLEALYDHVDNKSERIELLELVGDPNVTFDSGEEGEHV